MKLTKSEVLAESYGTTLNNENFVLEDGSEVSRTVVRRPHASAIVALTESNNVIMIRQVREAVNEDELLEVPAGKIDEGETPEQAAIRELKEECGITVEKINFLKKIYPSPGYTAEEIYLYIATGLQYGEQDLDEDEKIEVLEMDIDNAISNTSDAKSLVALFLAKDYISIMF